MWLREPQTVHSTLNSAGKHATLGIFKDKCNATTDIDYVGLKLQLQLASAFI